MDEARAVAAERAPDATDDIDALRDRLDEHREELRAPERLPATDADGGVAATRKTPILDDEDVGGGDVGDGDVGDVDAGNRDGGNGDASEDETGSSANVDDAGAGSRDERVADPTEISAESYPSLVAAVFRNRGWSATVFEAGTARQYDVLAETGGPVGVTVGIWTAHPDAVEAVDAAAVERYAAFRDRADELDVAAVASAALLSGTAREHAAEHGVKVLDRDDLVRELDERAVARDSLPGSE